MITVRFQETWPLRRSEWMLAVATLGVGLVVALEGRLFERGNYDHMLNIMGQGAWATFVLAIGLTRTACLAINGHMRATPHLRMLGSFLTLFVWLTLTIAAFTNDYMPLSGALWPVFFVFDFISLLDAARDARVADKRAKEASVDRRQAHAVGGR